QYRFPIQLQFTRYFAHFPPLSQGADVPVTARPAKKSIVAVVSVESHVLNRVGSSGASRLLSTFHRRTARSSPIDAIHFPSGEKDTCRTAPSCPWNTLVTPNRVHKRTVPSSLADANRLLSGEKATKRT